MRSVRQAALLVFLAVTVQFLPAKTPRYSMDEAVAAALERNPDVAIARKKVEAAKGVVIQAHGNGPFP